MKAFFKKAGVPVLAALALAVLITAVSYLAGGAGLFSSLIGGLLSPVEKLAGNAVSSLERVYGYMHNYDELVRENAELKSRIASMEKEARLSADALRENERLRKLLRLSEKKPDYRYVDASVVSWDASSWASSFVIDKGSRAGLKEGDCVITEDGYVVGLIREVGANTSDVRTVIDSGTAIGALLQDASITAVAEGDFALMTKGCLKLTYVFDNSGVLIGDTVLTSGTCGVYPAGLVIGKVTDLKEDRSGYGAYGVITPSADLKALTQVFIIKYYEADNES